VFVEYTVSNTIHIGTSHNTFRRTGPVNVSKGILDPTFGPRGYFPVNVLLCCGRWWEWLFLQPSESEDLAKQCRVPEDPIILDIYLAQNFSTATDRPITTVLHTLQSFNMADNEDSLVNYDEEEVRSNNRQQQGSLRTSTDSLNFEDGIGTLF
jgi:hypothetical protein